MSVVATVTNSSTVKASRVSPVFRMRFDMMAALSLAMEASMTNAAQTMRREYFKRVTERSKPGDD